MNSDLDCVKDNGKKKRSRKKQLYQSILKQMEFYFSDASLTKDRYLVKCLKDDGCVKLAVFFNFNKIRALTSDINDIVKALQQSEYLEVSEENLTVRRITPIVRKENEDLCTIYVEQLPPDTDHDWLREVFSSYGTIEYVSIPKFKNGRIKGFGFIEFETPEEADAVVADYKNSGNYLSEMAPGNLRSIVTYEPIDNTQQLADEENESNLSVHSGVKNKLEMKQHKEKDAEPLKRKISEDDAVFEEDSSEVKKPRYEDKKVMVEKDSQQTETDDDVDNFEEGRKRKHRKKKKKPKKDKITAKNSGLQILSKSDWKKLRNSYLRNQKDKMKVLKKQLSQKPIRRNIRDEGNSIQKMMEKSENTNETEKYPVGVIVKWTSDVPIVDIKKLRTEAKGFSGMNFIDVKEGEREVYFRLNTSEDVDNFCKSAPWQELAILEGQEEKWYWKKIQEDRTKKLNKKKVKERGKSKLIRKAEKALGKHIVFEKLEDE